MMKNIEYLIRKKDELKPKQETISLCKICYQSKYKAKCSSVCNGCEFDKYINILNFLNSEYSQTYEISQYEYDVLDCVKCSNKFYNESRFKDFEMLMRMKEKGHFKNINKETLIIDMFRRLVIIENKQISIKHQEKKQKNNEENKAKKMFEKLGFKQNITGKLIIIYNSPTVDVTFYELTKTYAIKFNNEETISIHIPLTFQKAINQQLKELGWLDE